MDFKFKVTTIITILVALIGWFVVHQLNTERDLNNKKREIVLTYLVEVYDDFSRKIMKGDTSKKNINKWINDLDEVGLKIQLFGSKEQIYLLNKLYEEIAKDRKFNLDPILNNLRNELRSELNLLKISGNIKRISFSN